MLAPRGWSQAVYPLCKRKPVATLADGLNTIILHTLNTNTKHTLADKPTHTDTLEDSIQKNTQLALRPLADSIQTKALWHNN